MGTMIGRRQLLKTMGAGVAVGALTPVFGQGRPVAWERADPHLKPNLLFVFADQWRASAAGYAGNVDVRTPHLDALARTSVNFRNAVSGCPVCSPFRASLVTGRYPLSHGVFLNDVLLNDDAVSIAQAYNRAGPCDCGPP